MSGGVSLCESDLAPLLDSDAVLDDEREEVEEIEYEEEVKVEERVQDQAKLLSPPLPLFDLHNRSLCSTVTTMCPSMHFSWHGVSAYSSEEKSRWSRDRSSSSGSIDVEKSGLKGEKERKMILNQVFGVAQPGEVLAIMGSSGAGKTTLLNLLAQRNTKGIEADGAIKVNGLRVNRDFMQKISAYVEQEDAFIGSLTVKEHLHFVASLRMGKRYTRKEQEKRVESVMKELALLPSADTIIKTKYRSGLSGGEKKRLAFAAEILTSPPILLCDEPTSGLDSFLAFQVVSVLKSLARRKGMTVLLTIHQPSSQVFGLFDRLYLMAEGRVAFSGTPAQARDTWNKMGRPLPMNFNPADHYINTLAVTSGAAEGRQRREVARQCDSFATSPEGRALQREARTGEIRKESERDEMRSSEQGQLKRRGEKGGMGDKYKSTWLQQLCALSWRVEKTILRDPSLMRTQLTQTIIIALLTGIIFLGTPLTQATVMNINGAIWQNIVNQAFLFNFSSMHSIIGELPIFLREHTSSLYRTDTYFLARNLVEMIPYTLYSFIFSSILYWMAGLVADFQAFLIFALVSALLINLSISFAYLVSCIFSSRAVAATVLPVFTVPALAFSGFYINVETLPPYFLPLRFLSYFSYAYEALAANQWIRVDEIPGCAPSSKGCYHSGQDVLDKLAFHPENQLRNILVMAGMLIVVRLMAFVALYIKSRRH